MTPGNKVYASYGVQAGEILFVFTAPYNNKTELAAAAASGVPMVTPHPAFDSAQATQFVSGESHVWRVEIIVCMCVCMLCCLVRLCCGESNFFSSLF